MMYYTSSCILISVWYHNYYIQLYKAAAHPVYCTVLYSQCSECSSGHLFAVPHGALAPHHDLASCVLLELLGSHAPWPQYPPHKIELQSQTQTHNV